MDFEEVLLWLLVAAAAVPVRESLSKPPSEKNFFSRCGLGSTHDFFLMLEGVWMFIIAVVSTWESCASYGLIEIRSSTESVKDPNDSANSHSAYWKNPQADSLYQLTPDLLYSRWDWEISSFWLCRHAYADIPLICRRVRISGRFM